MLESEDRLVWIISVQEQLDHWDLWWFENVEISLGCLVDRIIICHLEEYSLGGNSNRYSSGSGKRASECYPPKSREWKVFQSLDAHVKNMAVTLPLVHELHSPAMRGRHWKALMQTTVMNFDKGPGFCLDDLLALKLQITWRLLLRLLRQRLRSWRWRLDWSPLKILGWKLNCDLIAIVTLKSLLFLLLIKCWRLWKSITYSCKEWPEWANLWTFPAVLSLSDRPLWERWNHS